MREAEFRVLEAAVESWIGLWEVVWILRPLTTGQADSEIAPLAQRLVERMTDQGQLYLARLEARPTDGVSETIDTVLTARDMQNAISHPASWDPPQSDRDPC